MSSKKVVSHSESHAPAAIASVHPVPTSVSAPPAEWLAPEKLGKKGRRPKHGLILAAPTLATELQTNAAAIAAELGPKAVDPAQLAAAIDLANSWSGAEQKAATFHVYTKVERSASWDAALKLMSSMRLGVQFAVARDATFADRFPTVAKAFAPGKRSKKKTETEAATPAPQATETATKA
jgi:hypothetical protein